MRLGVYADFAYRRTARGLETDQAFVLFAAALGAYVDRLVLIGRLDPSPQAWHHRVPAGVGFAALPYYAALSQPVVALRSTAGTVRAFWRALDDLDAVWLLGPHPYAVAFAVLARARRRTVVLGVRQHLPEYVRHRHPGRRALLGAAAALEAAFRALAVRLPVVAVGPELARGYRHARRLLVVPISLVSRADLAGRSAPRSWDGPLTALSVGRLDAEKNPLLLADVLAALDQRWRLSVCGDGALAGELAARLSRLGVADRAELRGYVPVGGGLRTAYATAHALVHVSWTEGFPQVIVEAFAAGLPVVATDVGAVAELAGGAALLVPPGDASAAAAALERLRADPELRERLVAQGRRIAAEHTLEATARRVAGFIAGRPLARSRSRAKVLVLAPRQPVDDGKGDQLRAAQLIRALAATYDVEVVAPERLRRSIRAAGALGALLRAQPLQVGWMMPGPAWRAARRRAADADVVVAVTARAIRGPLPVPVILDHVDALSLNMRRRAAGPEPAALRLAARVEAALLARWERRVARWAAAQAAISADDAAHLPAPPAVQVLPNSIAVGAAPSPDAAARDIDVVLTGNMAYPPNADAARWLSAEIAPALWRRRPDASVWVVGRDAGRLVLDPRIEVRADVPDIAAYLRRARVALAPLRLGTGAPNKVLEAMAAGAAVVATPAAVAPFAEAADAVAAADDPAALAALADQLLGDEALRLRRAAAGRRVVAAYGPDAQRRRVETLVRSVLRD